MIQMAVNHLDNQMDALFNCTLDSTQVSILNLILYPQPLEITGCIAKYPFHFSLICM